MNEYLLQVADHRPLSDDDRHQLAEYSRRLSALQSASDTYRHRSYKCTAQISCVWRPLQVKHVVHFNTW